MRDPGWGEAPVRPEGGGGRGYRVDHMTAAEPAVRAKQLPNAEGQMPVLSCPLAAFAH